MSSLKIYFEDARTQNTVFVKEGKEFRTKINGAKTCLKYLFVRICRSLKKEPIAEQGPVTSVKTDAGTKEKQRFSLFFKR